MTEKCRKALDIGDHTRALLNDLSKVFYCIDHKLLLGKLNIYGVDSRSLLFLFSHLENTKQKTKINSYCNFEKLVSVVPQGAILGTLLFDIYICK